jgi:hypothetical protein
MRTRISNLFETRFSGGGKDSAPRMMCPIECDLLLQLINGRFDGAHGKLMYMRGFVGIIALALIHIFQQAQLFPRLGELDVILKFTRH